MHHGLKRALAAAIAGAGLVAAWGAPAAAQSVTIVGTQHLKGLDTPPAPEQYQHAIDLLSQFAPTQVCIERMSGERLQAYGRDPMRNAMALSPQTHGRPLGTLILPLGVNMQTRLAVLPADAREEAADLAARWDELDPEARIRLIALQIAGYEFHSAVLNWSYLDDAERQAAASGVLEPAAPALTDMLTSHDEAYALAVPLARRAGLHELCTADALEYEAAGMQAALERGGQEIFETPSVAERLEAYTLHMDSQWRPDGGPDALSRMLAYMNSDAFIEYDLENQWELMRRHDNEAGAFHRRLMYWHARTAQISSELYRALAQGPSERVLFIVGAAHRSFNEAEMRAQPWLTVEPASDLFSGLEPAPDDTP
jgi:hypothetical protein